MAGGWLSFQRRDLAPRISIRIWSLAAPSSARRTVRQAAPSSELRTERGRTHRQSISPRPCRPPPRRSSPSAPTCAGQGASLAADHAHAVRRGALQHRALSKARPPGLLPHTPCKSERMAEHFESCTRLGGTCDGPRCSRYCAMPPSPAARWYVWNGPMWAKRMPGPWLIAASMSATEACADRAAAIVRVRRAGCGLLLWR